MVLRHMSNGLRIGWQSHIITFHAFSTVSNTIRAISLSKSTPWNPHWYDWDGQGIHLFIYTMSWFLYRIFSRDALLLTMPRPDLFYKSSYFLCLAKARFVFISMGELGGTIFIQQMYTHTQALSIFSISINIFTNSFSP